MREAVLDFTQRIPLLIVDGDKTSNLGYRGEHNATQLTVIPPKEFEDNESIVSYRVCFGGECSGYETSSFYKAVSGNNITFPLPIDVTSNPVVSIQLEGWGEENILIVKTPVYRGATFGYAVSTNDVWADDPKVYDSLTNMDCGIIALDVDSAGYATNVLVYGNFAGGLDFTDDNRLKKITLIGCTKIPDGMFRDCRNLEEVIIADTTTSIGEYAFYSCKSLQKIRLPQSIVSIGDSAFEGCEKLYEINLPNTLNNISGRLFAFCSSLKQLELPNGIHSIGSGAYQHSGITGDIVIPKSVSDIKSYTFAYCSNITSISIPDSVTNIDYAAFLGCEGLLSVNLPESITEVSDNLFDSCTSLENIEIPDSVTSIGQYSFRYCSALKNVKLSSNITSIGKNAFTGCTSVQAFDIPENVSSIGSNAFSNCTAITTFTFPNPITRITASVLSNCSQLKSIHIDELVQQINASAFDGCENLATVHIKAALPPTINRTNPFPYKNGKLKIFVPSSDESVILNLYKTKENWSTIESYDSNIITEWGDYVGEVDASSVALTNSDIDSLINA